MMVQCGVHASQVPKTERGKANPENFGLNNFARSTAGRIRAEKLRGEKLRAKMS